MRFGRAARRRAAVSLVLMALLLEVSGVAVADHVDLSEMEPFAPPGAIDAVEQPKFDDIEYVLPSEQVIGVTIGDDARAYPIKVLVYHEIVNDVVGGVPVAVTYCPLCGVGLVYERIVRGRILFFNVSGLLYRNNLVMVDNWTGSLWPQILGNAANGTYHGTPLVLRTSTRTTWEDWKSLYPGTKLLARPVRPVCFSNGTCIDPGFSYDVDPYAARYDYYNNASTFQARRYPDNWMHPKTFVLALARHREARAYAYPDLVRERVVNDLIGGDPIVVVFANTSAKAFLRGDRVFTTGPNGTIMDDSGQAFDSRTGEGVLNSLVELPAFWGFWFAWKDLHPDTCVYRIGCPSTSSRTILPFAAAVGTGAALAIAYSTRRFRRQRLPEATRGTRVRGRRLDLDEQSSREHSRR
jgi:Protein of unknown function (DUF3179)